MNEPRAACRAGFELQRRGERWVQYTALRTRVAFVGFCSFGVFLFWAIFIPPICAPAPRGGGAWTTRDGLVSLVSLDGVRGAVWRAGRGALYRP